MGLPLSSVASSASSSACARMRSPRRNRMRCRSAGLMRGQAPPSKAARAAATARSTSATPAMMSLPGRAGSSEPLMGLLAWGSGAWRRGEALAGALDDPGMMVIVLDQQGQQRPQRVLLRPDLRRLLGQALDLLQQPRPALVQAPHGLVPGQASQRGEQ